MGKWSQESTGDTGGFDDRDEHDAALRSGNASALPDDTPVKKKITKKKGEGYSIDDCRTALRTMKKRRKKIG